MALTRPTLKQLNTTNVKLSDPLNIINSNSTAANVDVGFVFNRDGGSTANVAVIWDETNDQFTIAFTADSGVTNSNVAVTGYPEIVTGNLIPGGNLTYYLGSVDNQWHSLYVGPGSLYVNGQKVLQEDSGTIVFSADENQNISIQTAGSGDIEFNPGGSIELKGNVVLSAGKTLSQAGGAASEFSAGVKADSVTARTTNTSLTLSGNGTGVVNVNDSLTVANDVTVTGNLTVNGATTTVSSTNTTIEDALLLLSDGTSGAPTKDSGLIIERGSAQNVGLIWDESADAFSIVTTSDDATTVGDITIVDYANLRAGHATFDDGFTLGGTLITATAAEINYLDGVTSSIQTQIDNISSSFTLAADSGTSDTFTTGQTLTVAGGTGIDTTVTDNQISIAVDSTIATQTYADDAVTTANVNLKGYVDNELTSYATTTALTTANVNVVGYVDDAVSTANVNLKGYTDNLVTTANVNVVGYVDNAVTTANVNLKGYTDNEITTANVNLKGYSDGTFAPLAGATYTGTVDLSARNRLRFSDTDNSNYVEFRAPGTITNNVTWTLPSADGTSGQAMVTDGAGNLSWATASGGGGGASGFQASTISTHPAAGGNEDLRTGPNDDTAETPFEAGGSDSFGVSLGSVYDQMEPVGSLVQIDLGDEESYVGA